MIIQKRDGSLMEEPVPVRNRYDRERYYVEVEPNDVDEQASLVARLITMAFDVLGARHLEVRVRGDEEW